MKMMRLRHLATITNSNVDKLTNPDEEPVRLCNYVDVYKNDRITNDLAFMAATATRTEIERFRLRVGDVLITKDSEERTDIGVPAYVEDAADDLVCGYHLSLLRARPHVARGDFLFWALQSKPARDAFSNAASGVTRFGLTLDGMKSVEIICPDLLTQESITDFLDRETARIDQLIETAGGQIAARSAKPGTFLSLLIEKRAAIITAAVTGQIDVTTWGKRDETDRYLNQGAHAPRHEATA